MPNGYQLHIEATGLGGRDLGYPERWNLSLRSDPEGQHVYGPSLANVETITVEGDGSGATTTKHVSALGLQKLFFFLAGCNRSLGYRQSRLKRRKDTRRTKT